MSSGAVFNADGTRRFQLLREWLTGDGFACWIMRNPSLAGVDFDDPTIRVIRGVSTRLGFAGMVICNLDSTIATIPQPLTPGPEDDLWIAQTVTDPRVRIVIVAWGAVKPDERGRVEQVLKLLPRPVFCLGRNADGTPWHPLRRKIVGLEIFLDKEKVADGVKATYTARR